MQTRGKFLVLNTVSKRSLSFVVQSATVFAFFIFAAESSSVSSMILFPNSTEETFTLWHPLNFLSLLMLLVIICALLFPVYHVQQRFSKRAQVNQNNGGQQLQLDQLAAIFDSENNSILVTWFDSSTTPKIFGKLSERADISTESEQFLKFEDWLTKKNAANLESSISALLKEGKSFNVQLKTNSGVNLEISGKKVDSLALMRLQEAVANESDRYDNVEVQEFESVAHNFLVQFLDTWSGLSWIRNKNGKLIWINKSFCQELGAKNIEEAISDTPEFILNLINQKEAKSKETENFFGQVTVLTDSETQIYKVCEFETKKGIVGFATVFADTHPSESETSQSVRIQPKSLNYLSIAVAIFNSEQQLVFHNDAYQQLWEFDDEFLKNQPLDGEILNFLRLQRKLPEQENFMNWRNDLLSIYQSKEVQNFFWYLPDSRTLRVFMIPRNSGGVIYFFENVTEQIRFESRVNTMNQVQGETLDHLSDAVSVFGSNGRLRLWNPAFAELWQQSSKFLKEFPHISEVAQRINLSENETALWNKFAEEVTQVSEVRTNLNGQIERKDGIILDYSLAPLPDGGMLITFVDVTDSINIERALIEKNEALKQADELKNNFIQHVSYEFRSPLTSIIGFAQMLSDPNLGILTTKQSEYMDHILASSSALLTLIDDILDLATIDAGIMELDLVDVDIQETVEAVIEGINDRLKNSNVELEVNLADDIGAIVADRSRVRQILFNLVSNAVNFSADNGKVEIGCERLDDKILFKIQDHGSGIPKEYLPKVFENFVSWGQGEKRRGVGLGLPIVKRFVEMHGGEVTIESKLGAGTLVIVSLPLVANSKKTEGE